MTYMQKYKIYCDNHKYTKSEKIVFTLVNKIINDSRFDAYVTNDILTDLVHSIEDILKESK